VAVDDRLLVMDKVEVGLLEAILCEIRFERAQAIRVSSSICVRERTRHTTRKGRSLRQENREGWGSRPVGASRGSAYGC
jgi:hypothetical protein